MNLLEIRNLHASIGGKPILKGLNLDVRPGELHAIMGPNGAGKSTLSKVIAGHPDYDITDGEVRFEINFRLKNLLELEADERAREGLFLAFQYPVEVPGVSNPEFLRAAFNAVVRHQGGEEMDALDFQDFLLEKMKLLDIPGSFLDRQVNVDFSGGEKKRNEILQMAVLSPRLAFLDETDSGLDVDSLRQVAAGINRLRKPENAFVLITHYHRLLEYCQPDRVHVLHDGQIIASGDQSLAPEIEKRGYEYLIKEFREKG